MPAHTEDTKIDLKRPSVARGLAADAVPSANTPDLDLEDDAATIQLSRLAWPEPPRRLSERLVTPSELRVTPRPVATALSRSVAPLLQHPDTWYRVILAAIVMAGVAVFFGRPNHGASTTAHEAIQLVAPVETAAPRRAPPAPLAPLVLTVGNSSSVGGTPATSTKPPISVSKLPLAPRTTPKTLPSVKRASKPLGRMKSLSPTSAARSAASSQSVKSTAGGIDDGF